MMNQEVKELFPQWTKEKQDRHLILSNDLDSLLSCTLLNKQFGYEINAYYSFDEGLVFIDSKCGKKHIGVDIALSGQKYCWDNHVTILGSNSIINKNSANINTVLKISAQNKTSYYKKFAGSTAMQIWSYYDFELPKTDEGKMMLLAIDSAYLGFYSRKFKDRWINYMEQLGFEELVEFCERYTENEFKEFKKLYTENVCIYDDAIYYDDESRKFVEDCLEMALYIPTEKFDSQATMKAHCKIINNVHDLSRDKDVFSYAVTSPDIVKYTTINQLERGD